MVNPDASHAETQKPPKKEVKQRQRASTSCTECRKRKQKCNQAKERPCNNCSRRYPPVPCVYEIFKKATKFKEAVIELEVPELKKEDIETGRSKTLALATLHEENEPRGNAPFYGTRHPSLPLPTRTSSSVSWHQGYQELSKDPKPLDSGPILVHAAHVWDISPAFRIGRYFAYPELVRQQYEYSDIPSGGVAIEPLVSLPVEPSRRNAELFHFFIQRLAPFMCSTDGNDAPATFLDQWLRFMTQSPIAINIALLTASYFQATSRQIQVENSIDAMTAKGRLINLINTHIVTSSKGVNEEAIAAVMSLAYNELVYSDEKSTLAHMRGLREMVRTRGGIHNITFPLLRKLLLRTDFQVALTFERPLFLHTDEFSHPLQPLTTYPLHLDCPFLLSPHRFVDNLHIHNIAPETAQILDDARWLTTSILHLSTTQYGPDPSSPEHQKFLATAQWIYSRLSSPSPPLTSSPSNPFQAAIHQTLLTTTLTLLTSLLSRQPLSQSLTPALLMTIWQNMWIVPLPVWKRSPGLFFFVLLIVNPGARERVEGRFLKGMLAATAITIGTSRMDGKGGGDGWEVLRGIVGSVLGVQRWLGGGGGGVGEMRAEEVRSEDI
ncbi:uncharacterized protein PAC_14510 [Phialocephala subalpina]|uniref:Zn(2)-C6 fungal-type domain-containing protein n=1 Tax=Phialocephala subalpina TaxID=576137 RepID=A0A1L7XHV9_9HELO|nr:uncharacterized protein PAC_14510 [Phialocephala subalpina]